jgi:hypothetical protein
MTTFKPLEILNTVEEYDGTKTIYFKVTKIYAAETEEILKKNTMESFYNFNPNEVEDPESKIFELLEQKGWI